MSDTRYPIDSGITIRDATESDIPAIQDIARLTWADTYRGIIPEDAQVAVLNRAYSKESLAVSIARKQAFLVAEVGCASPASIAGYVDVDFDGRQMNLHRLYIHPGRQRLGLGRMLLCAAVHHMLKTKIVSSCGPARVGAGCASPSCRLVAHVERDNPKARAFYKKMGFVEDEEEIVVIGGVSLPVLRISMTVGGEASVR